ncbi:MAG: hypothetical protein P0Y64_00540 [Candidatus Sphingomonas colombiensis]|nr:hypothetical protein [Sphingomonas sp.]WEK43379.1 MAG: hypothetical protein P0Y64_00540 [Sphingomonas sp.]
MLEDTRTPKPQAEAGIATAENGYVFLDGPDGVAVTMTSEAAAQTGINLIDAAARATQQGSKNRTCKTSENK